MSPGRYRSPHSLAAEMVWTTAVLAIGITLGLFYPSPKPKPLTESDEFAAMRYSRYRIERDFLTTCQETRPIPEGCRRAFSDPQIAAGNDAAIRHAIQHSGSQILEKPKPEPVTPRQD